MTNGLYASYRSQALSADCDLDDSIVFVFSDHGVDTPVIATDDFYDDINTATIATSGALSTKTYTGGVFDADDKTVTSVSGAQFESINIIDNTPGTNATKDLICYIDTATGLPCTPNGGDIAVAWDNGANKIFKI